MKKKVTVELDEAMQEDLWWLIDHFEGKMSLEGLINDLLEDIVGVWHEAHSSTGVCAECEV